MSWRLRLMGEGSWPGWTGVLALAATTVLAGCGGGDDVATPGTPSPTESAAAQPVASARGATPVPQLPRPVTVDPNPLGLPARELDVAVGARVFAVPEPMLRGAKLGSTLVLASARVVGRDGDAILVETREGQPYRIHPGYVVALPTGKKPGVGDPVVVEHAGVLKHGVLRARKKGKAIVRLFDAGDTADRAIDEALVTRAEDGFRPGHFAAARVDGELRHVLLVSPLEAAEGQGGARRWLALGHAGAGPRLAPRRGRGGRRAGRGAAPRPRARPRSCRGGSRPRRG